MNGPTLPSVQHPRRGAANGARRSRGLLLALLTLFALIGNTSLLEAHRHPLQRSVSVGTLGDQIDTDAGTCALCDAAAALEPLLPVGDAALPVRIAEDTPAVAMVLSARAVPGRTHGWRSRAPPEVQLA